MEHAVTSDLKITNGRIESIDLLRGAVIVIMALDHVRDYFNADAFLFDPTDMTKTSAALFLTRWITHFCAPVFVFLAGTSAYLIGLKKGTREMSAFLFKRGIWLIFLEFTVINFAWFFNVRFSFIALTVIWALAVGMIALAALVRIPKRVLLAVSIAALLLHNAFDNFHIAGDGFSARIWAILHEQQVFSWGEGRTFFTGYGIWPWTALLVLGYCFGELYSPAFGASRRRKMLLIFGYGAIGIFIVLRLSNLYGDPHVWAVQPSPVFTVLSFLNCTKYPSSLLYLLMTLGPAMLVLAYTEQARGRISEMLTMIGRVPLFFYVIHIYIIHIIALGAAVATGFTVADMTFDTWITNSASLRGYGFGLGVVYFMWLVTMVLMYPLCKRFDAYKRAHREKWWLSYC